MITVTATNLRNDLFNLLARVSEGEIIAIIRNGREVGKIIPSQTKDWRDKMKTKGKLLVPPEEAFAPMEDVWEDYL